MGTQDDLRDVEDPYKGLGSGGLRKQRFVQAAKKPETVYVAGPMRGLKDFNYPQFRGVAKVLRDQGYVVNCPAENFGGDSTKKFSEYMQADIKMVLESDGIVLLPGWQSSEGAKLEIAVARALGLKFYEAHLSQTGLGLEIPAGRAHRGRGHRPGGAAPGVRRPGADLRPPER